MPWKHRHLLRAGLNPCNAGPPGADIERKPPVAEETPVKIEGYSLLWMLVREILLVGEVRTHAPGREPSRRLSTQISGGTENVIGGGNFLRIDQQIDVAGPAQVGVPYAKIANGAPSKRGTRFRPRQKAGSGGPSRKNSGSKGGHFGLHLRATRRASP